MCSQITILNWKIELERFGWFTVNVFYYRKCRQSEWIRRWKFKETFLKQFRVLKIGHKGRWVEIVVVPYLTSHHCALCRCWWWFQGQRSKYKVSTLGVESLLPFCAWLSGVINGPILFFEFDEISIELKMI